MRTALAAAALRATSSASTPRAPSAGAKYLAAFVEEMKAAGIVAEALGRHRIEGAIVAPAAGP